MLHRSWRIVLLVVGVVLVSSYPLQAQTDNKSLFTKLIGPHTLAFGHCQVNELVNIPSVQQLVKSFPGGQEEADKQVIKLTSVKLSEIDTVTFYVDQFTVEGTQVKEPPPPYFLIRTKSAIDRLAVITGMGKDNNTISFGKYELLLGKDYGLSILDDNSLLFVTFGPGRAKENAQRLLVPYFAMLETSNEIPDGLKKSVELALSRKHHMITGVTIKKEMSELGEEIFQKAPAAVAPFKPLVKKNTEWVLDNGPPAEWSQ